MEVIFLSVRRCSDRLLDRRSLLHYTLAVFTGGTDSEADILDTGADLVRSLCITRSMASRTATSPAAKLTNQDVT